MTFGPAFRSMDGEYRRRFITNFEDKFKDAMKLFSDVMEPIEELVVRRMEEGELTFRADIHHLELSPHDTHFRELKDSMERERVIVRSYAISWLVHTVEVNRGTLENHVSESYSRVFGSELLDFEALGLDKDRVNTLVRNIGVITATLDGPMPLLAPIECGQKIFPMHVADTIYPGDIGSPVWREIYISTVCSSLVTNFISPCFPFNGDWFFIGDSDAELFDNPNMHDRFAHSAISNEIATELRRIDHMNYLSGDYARGPINSKFARLSRNINGSISFADQSIQTTDVALCLVSEYVGRTLRDIPDLLQAPGLGEGGFSWLANTVSSHKSMTKHIFEFISGFYQMNRKLGIIHGDAHLNNLCLFKLRRLENVLKPADKPLVCYVVDDVPYAFQHWGAFSMIIDMSRALLSDRAAIAREIGAHRVEAFIRHQHPAVARIIMHHFPSLLPDADASDKLSALLLANFGLAFKILTAADTFAVASNMLALVDYIPATPARTRDLLARVAKHAEDLVLVNLAAAMDGKIKTESDVEWPNLEIIREHFKDNVLAPGEMAGANIVDLYNGGNSIAHDMSSIHTSGPFLDGVKGAELIAKYGIVDEEQTRFFKRYHIDETVEVEELAKKYKPREKLVFEPWMFG